MVKRPDGMNAFEFSVLSGLRAAQLSRGCTPRVDRAARWRSPPNWKWQPALVVAALARD
jgi:hypothetical protein